MLISSIQIVVNVFDRTILTGVWSLFATDDDDSYEAIILEYAGYECECTLWMTDEI